MLVKFANSAAVLPLVTARLLYKFSGAVNKLAKLIKGEDNMQSNQILIKNKTGLHARPASEFVKAAGKFKSAITIEFKDKKINAKSIVHVLSAGISAGSTIVLTAEGEDEQQAIETLTDVIDKFEE